MAASPEIEEATVQQLDSSRAVEGLAPAAGVSLPRSGSLVLLVTPRESMQPAVWPLEADGKS